jgi:hypothetical protein
MQLNQIINNKYKVIDYLDKGACGVVFKLIDINTNIKYALKIIDCSKFFD